ncbi:MAG: NAD-dependent epimerase/dehydratase family protein [Bryobacterales bacterium]|nr:NAD-dependent epimerase/dehydratase family protein [Bryobacterales bacterium]
MAAALGQGRVKRVLVTGATGFLGWHIAHQLLERGERVRVLARDPRRVVELEGVETMAGDLRDADSVARAMEGCSVVYHAAADYRLWARHGEELYQSNVDGTRNILRAAREAGVERLVYTSTVGCIGIPSGGIGDEAVPVALESMTGAYKRSKFLAEQTALSFAGEGFPVVIVNPTAPVGDHDRKPTPTGKIIVDFLRGKMPAYIDTGLNLVDAGDTAKGHLLAAEKGKPGERYILGCENLTLKEILERLGRLAGVPAPRIQVPYAVAYATGICSTAWAMLTGSEPRAPLDGVRMARKKMFVSWEKARRELGFAPGPVDRALERAIQWFRANGYIA